MGKTSLGEERLRPDVIQRVPLQHHRLSRRVSIKMFFSDVRNSFSGSMFAAADNISHDRFQYFQCTFRAWNSRFDHVNFNTSTVCKIIVNKISAFPTGRQEENNIRALCTAEANACLKRTWKVQGKWRVLQSRNFAWCLALFGLICR